MKLFIPIAILLSLAVGLFPLSATAQQVDQNQSKANYALAKKANLRALYGSLGDTILNPHWVGDNCFWYSFRTSTGTEYIFVDAAKAYRQKLFTKKAFIEAFSSITGIDTDNAPDIANIVQAEGAFSVSAGNYLFSYDVDKEHFSLISEQKPVEASESWKNSSPDGTVYLFAKNYNLYLGKADEEQAALLSSKGECYFGYNVTGWTNYNDHLNNDDQPKSCLALWSPDSQYALISRTDYRKTPDTYLLDSRGQTRPQLVSMRVSMPADDWFPRTHIELYNQKTNELQEILVTDSNHASFDSYKWAEDSKHIFFVARHRNQKKVELIRYNVETGENKLLLVEESDSLVLTKTFHLLPGGSGFIWWSRRDGFGNYYIYDSEGNLNGQLTQGSHVVDQIVQADIQRMKVFFTATNNGSDYNPYFTQLYSVNIDGSGQTLLTDDKKHHIVNLSPDCNFFVDTICSIESPHRMVLRDATGAIVMELEHSDMTALEELGWQFPEEIVSKAADGKTDIWGVMWKPFDFDPSKKYPVVTVSYPGPQNEFIPTSYSERLENVTLAQFGFIVLVNGNRGGSYLRPVDYTRFGFGNMRDYAIADKKVSIENLASERPYMDLSRVGIWGSSSGGYLTATAMFTYPEFFKVGVARAGFHDPEMLHRYWSEQFEGVDELVEDNKTKFKTRIAGNNLELAKNLQGHLLIMQGETDLTVHPMNAMKLAEALIKAKKRFDMIILPGGNHNWGVNWQYEQWIIWTYFTEHLLGDKPMPGSIFEN